VVSENGPFLSVSDISVEEKLDYAMLGLVREALTWFEWWEAKLTFHTWLCFKQDLLKRFEPGATSNPLAPLLQVKQTGSIMEYQRDFELAARSHRNLDGETLLCMFHEGLKSTIKSELDVAEFESLQALMDLAMVVNGDNANPKSIEGFNRGTNWVRPNNFNSYFGCSPPPKPKENQVTHTTASSSSGPKHNSHWIPNEEWLECQRKGLCYKCEEKWNPSHTCRHRHQHLVLIDADEEEELEPTPEEIIEEPSTLNLQTLSLHLSSFSYWGFTSHHTFKAKGMIQGSEVIVLVDLEAEANFLSTHILSFLGLPLSLMRPVQVEVGNDAIEPGVGGCKNVELIVQGVLIVANFLVMELGRSEVVLSVSWVASLGKFEGDYKQLTLSWMSNESRVTLQGDPNLSRSNASGKMTLNALKNNKEGFLVTPLFYSDGDNITSPITIETLELLQQFNDIFQEPFGMSSFILHDHTILLKENSEIAAYPFTPKDIVALFIKEVVHLHGFPSSIVTDRDKILSAHSRWNYLSKLVLH